KKDLDLLAQAVEKGADLNCRKADAFIYMSSTTATRGNAPLLYTAVMKEFYDRDIVDFLLDNGVDVNKPAQAGWQSVLEVVVMQDRTDVAEHLLERGADPKKAFQLAVEMKKSEKMISL